MENLVEYTLCGVIYKSFLWNSPRKLISPHLPLFNTLSYQYFWQQRLTNKTGSKGNKEKVQWVWNWCSLTEVQSRADTMLFGNLSSSIAFQTKYVVWQCGTAAAIEAGGKGWTLPAVKKVARYQISRKKIAVYRTCVQSTGAGHGVPLPVSSLHYRAQWN